MAPRHGMGTDYLVALPAANVSSAARLLLEAVARLGPAVFCSSGTRVEFWTDAHAIAPDVIAEASDAGLWVSDLGGDPQIMDRIRAWLGSRGLVLRFVINSMPPCDDE